MKLIVGLGNPGTKYENTRHNIGFMFIDFYAKEKNIMNFKEKFKGLYATFNINNETIILFKPLTYMNLSGEAILEIVNFYNIPMEDILVIYDDVDLPFATLRLREKGHPGSHNGLKNITALLNDINFKRIRVGIGKPNINQDMINFVLSKFNKEEINTLNESFKNVMASCDYFINNNFNMAMNKFNIKKKENE